MEKQSKVGDNKNLDTTANPLNFKQTIYVKDYYDKLESVYSKIFVTKNSLIDINDPYGFSLLVMGRSYAILEADFVRIKTVEGTIVLRNLLGRDNPNLGYGIFPPRDQCSKFLQLGVSVTDDYVQVLQSKGFIKAELSASNLDKTWLSFHMQETMSIFISVTLASKKY